MGIKKYQYFVFLAIYFHSCCYGQSRLGKPISESTRVDIDIQLVDTIMIKDPILIKFKENQNGDYAVQSILVTTSYVDTAYKNMPINYREFLYSKEAYLFFTASRFSCILSNLTALRELPYYNKLEGVLRNAEKDTIWVKVNKSNDKPKKYHSLEYNEIYPRNFLLFLVKGSAIRRCQTLDEIIIKDMDNVYFKVLVPITW